MKKFTFSLLLMGLLFGSVSSNQSFINDINDNLKKSGKAYVVTCQLSHVRSVPSPKGDIIAALPKGFVYKIVDAYGHWTFVNGIDAKTKKLFEGYIWTKAIDNGKVGGEFAPEGAKIHIKPDSKSKLVHKAWPGSEIKTKKIILDWLQIEMEESKIKFGWVHIDNFGKLI